jgi:hypothetical protein
MRCEPEAGLLDCTYRLDDKAKRLLMRQAEDGKRPMGWLAESDTLKLSNLHVLAKTVRVRGRR